MLSDDSGGRTEIVQGARNLDQATAGIASELSQQYFLGYVSTRPKDGRWHDITVRVKSGNYQVRARRRSIEPHLDMPAVRRRLFAFFDSRAADIGG